jgi:N-acetylneuraminate synthase
MRTFIIAEAGVNHNGDLDKALELVDVASRAGVDAIKFQTFDSKSLTTAFAPKAKYQKENTTSKGSQQEMLEGLELSKGDYSQILNLCKERSIKFLSTAFDSSSLSFLINDLKIDKLKIPSGEITNGPFLIDHAITGLDMIISTGMSNLKEIETALGVVAFGYLRAKNPCQKSFQKAFHSEEGQKKLKEKVTLLHCTSQYPTLNNDINLKAISTLKSKFNLKVGYSDHSEGILIASNAVSLGAELIEKHFTLDKDLPGPDHKSSLDPFQLDELVKTIRTTEEFLGDGVKAARKSENENLIVSRKSIVASKEIRKGEIFTEENLTFKRPGSGINPMKFWKILNKKSNRNYSVDDLIDYD